MGKSNTINFSTQIDITPIFDSLTEVEGHDKEQAALAATSAKEAAASAAAAAESAKQAAESAQNVANNAKEAAESASSDAKDSATASAQSASAASASASAASGSASASAKSASDAKDNAAASAASATTAAGSAKTASDKANAAAASAIDASSSASAAAESAKQAAESASKLDDYNQTAKSWAVGGTGTRAGEDTNNAKYWCENAALAAGGGVTSFNSRGGIVTPQSGDYTAAMVGAGDGLIYDSETNKVYLTSGGQRIGDGVAMQISLLVGTPAPAGVETWSGEVNLDASNGGITFPFVPSGTTRLVGHRTSGQNANSIAVVDIQFSTSINSDSKSGTGKGYYGSGTVENLDLDTGYITVDGTTGNMTHIYTREESEAFNYGDWTFYTW